MNESQKAQARGFAKQFDISQERAAKLLAASNWNFNEAFSALLAEVRALAAAAGEVLYN